VISDHIRPGGTGFGNYMLSHAQLEAVRILTNAEMDAASPLACLLLGQPTLRRMLRLGVLAAWTSGSG
jgi:type II secretory pathway predicted ATPase ExeA